MIADVFELLFFFPLLKEPCAIHIQALNKKKNPFVLALVSRNQLVDGVCVFFSFWHFLCELDYLFIEFDVAGFGFTDFPYLHYRFPHHEVGH